VKVFSSSASSVRCSSSSGAKRCGQAEAKGRVSKPCVARAQLSNGKAQRARAS
jgi:hypothetical protein